MTENTIPPSSSLDDPWRSGTIPLGGLLERSGFQPWLTAILALVIAFVLFQFVVAPIATVVLLFATGTRLEELLDPAFLTALVGEKAELLLVANTIGQVLALAIPALILASLHSTSLLPFLRVRSVSPGLLVLSVVGLVGLFPVIQWLAEINAALPIPDFIREFERMMVEPIERLLSREGALGFNILMIALTPAICEELLFRGYVQRQAERSMGVIWGIVFTGVVFGFYHLQLTKVIPLAALGLFVAYITWRTGSLIPAIVVHFANNASAVIIGTYAATHPEMSLQDVENIDIPWYLTLAGIAFFAGAVYSMNRLARRQLEAAGRSTGGGMENDSEVVRDVSPGS